MSETNMGFTLSANHLRETNYVDSSVSHTILAEKEEAAGDDIHSETEPNVPQPSSVQTTTPKTWEESVRQLGREFAQIRQAQGRSLYQLHAETLVPLHILTALESGDLTRLPEKIYVQGFIRRIGDGLGLDGSKLADSLPVDRSWASVPAVRTTSIFQRIYFSRVHLYVGYIALLIAAVSGLSWISNENAREPSPESLTNRVTESETLRPEKPSVPDKTP